MERWSGEGGPVSTQDPSIQNKFRALLDQATGLSRLAASRAAAVRVLWTVLTGPVRRRFGILDAPSRLRLCYEGQPFEVHVLEATDIAVLREVFVRQEYALDLPFEPRVILDLGANIGSTVAYFKCVYPQSRIWAFEPDPRAFERLQRTTAALTDVQAEQVALTGEDVDAVHLYPARHTWASSTVVSHAESEPIAVRAKSLNRVVNELNVPRVDVLKVDVEGAEWEILSKFPSLKDVGAVAGEFHTDLAPVSAQRFFELFDGFDVRLWQDGEAHHFHAVRR